MPAQELGGFAAAATGLSTRPPTKRELLSFTKDFAGGYRCRGGLNWGPSRVLNTVLEFQRKFPQGSWLLFWRFLAVKVGQIADHHVRVKALDDLYRWITYADPTGETAVNNVVADEGSV